MPRPRIALLALACLLGSSVASATSVRTDDCDIDSDYGLRLHGGVIELTRDEGTPKTIRIDQGRLWLDGAEQTLNAADQRRIARIEEQIDAVVPEVRGIAIDAAAIAIQSIVHVAHVLGNENARDAKARAERIEKQFVSKLDEQLAGPGWDEAGLEAEIESLVADMAADFASEIAGLAVKAALSGDEKMAEDIEARAAQLEKVIESQVEERARMLEARARKLCPRREAIAELDDALELRTADGKPLDLVRR